MPLYKNVGGAHHTQDNKTIATGAVFESDDKDLRKKYPNKFELVGAEVKAAPVAAPVAPSAPTEEEGDSTVDENAPATDSTDATADFPTAGKNTLTVKKDKAGYWIMDDTDLVNEKALRTKKAVEAAIAEYVK